MQQFNENIRKDKTESVPPVAKLIIACMLVMTAFAAIFLSGTVLAYVVAAIFLLAAVCFLIMGVYSYFCETDLSILVQRRDSSRLTAVLLKLSEKSILNKKNELGNTLLHYALLDGRNIKKEKDLNNFLKILGQLITLQNINMPTGTAAGITQEKKYSWTPLDIAIMVAIKDRGTIQNDRTIAKLLEKEGESRFVFSDDKNNVTQTKLKTLTKVLQSNDVADVMGGWEIYEEDFKLELFISHEENPSSQKLAGGAGFKVQQTSIVSVSVPESPSSSLKVPLLFSPSSSTTKNARLNSK